MVLCALCTRLRLPAKLKLQNPTRKPYLPVMERTISQPQVETLATIGHETLDSGAQEALATRNGENVVAGDHETLNVDDSENGVAADHETIISVADGSNQCGIPKGEDELVRPFCSDEMLKALEFVERDATAIAGSFTSLFSSLRLALSEVTSTSVEHMRCFSDIAGRLQESALDAATKGNHFINSCLRLNEEMKGMESLVMQLYPFHGYLKPFYCDVR
ncbi:hypothetical protein AMTRI_Chr07g80970 [Amborella trichopoda]